MYWKSIQYETYCIAYENKVKAGIEEKEAGPTKSSPLQKAFKGLKAMASPRRKSPGAFKVTKSPPRSLKKPKSKIRGTSDEALAAAATEAEAGPLPVTPPRRERIQAKKADLKTRRRRGESEPEVERHLERNGWRRVPRHPKDWIGQQLREV